MKRLLSLMVLTIIALAINPNAQAAPWSYNFEDFSTNKTSTASKDVVLAGIRWQVYGATESFNGDDWFEDNRSMRLYGCVLEPGVGTPPAEFTYFMMMENRTKGIGDVSFWVRAYASHASDQASWMVQSSTDGISWSQEGQAFTPTMEPKQITVSINQANARIRIVRTDLKNQNRFAQAFNMDNITITDYVAPDPTTPSIIPSVRSVDFGSVKKGTSAEQTISISGNNLTESIAASITDATSGSFSVNVRSLPASGGTLILTFSPTQTGEQAAKLTLKSGDVTFAISLKGKGTGEPGSFSGGSGTIEDPYELANATDIVTLSTEVDNGKEYDNTYFVVTQDIDMSSVSNFLPIGTNFATLRIFRGSINGKGHTISNIRSVYTGKNIGVGFIGNLADGILENLKLSKCYFRAYSSVGSFVGVMLGKATVSNCHADNSVEIVADYSVANSGGIVAAMLMPHNTIVDCSFSGSIMADHPNGLQIGGILGTIGAGGEVSAYYSRIIRCANYGKVVGAMQATGGIVGVAEVGGVIEDCLNLGSISVLSGTEGKAVGGILGMISPRGLISYPDGSDLKMYIRNCYNSGSTVGGSPDLAGPITGSRNVDLLMKQPNCFFNKEVVTQANILSQEFGATQPKTTSELKAEAMITTLNAGRTGDAAPWVVGNPSTNGYPRLKTADPNTSLVSIAPVNNQDMQQYLSAYGLQGEISITIQQAQVRIYDMNSALVSSLSIDGTTTISLPAGTYVIAARTQDGQTQSSKVIVR